jgi:alpha-D-ribose 1-methylphosphonate 5-triphosphate synthase subunit PhnH
VRAGLADAVLDAQRVFRAVLDAMAHPGLVRDVAVDIDPPPPLDPATAAVCLTLVDFETPLWLDARARVPEVVEYLRFHCGVALVPEPGAARFALVVDPAALALDAFDAGTDERPDLSATLIVQVAALHAGRGLRLTGPGIAGGARLAAPGIPDAFWTARAVHAGFPRGVDLVLAAGSLVAALPRSTRVEAERGAG